MKSVIWITHYSDVIIGMMASEITSLTIVYRDDIIKWKHFLGYWPFVQGIHRSLASDAELWCFLWSAPNKLLSKQSWGWWFEMPSHPLWHHCNDSTVYSGADKRKYQSSASLAFVRGIHRDRWIPRTKGPVTRKMFPFDEVIMFRILVR